MSEELFAVTPEYQAKVLAMMLWNHEFCGVVKDVLKPEHFSNRALQWFFTTLSTADPMLTEVLLREEMLGAARSKHIREEEVPKFVSLFGIIKERPTPTEEAHIRKQLTLFMKTQAIKLAMEESITLAKNHRFEEILGLMQDAVEAGIDFEDMGLQYFVDSEDRIKARATREKRRRISSGIPDLDLVTNGGIKNKQMGLIVGGTGRGKSLMLQWLSRTAVLLGKKVVYFTLELYKDDMADRFDSMFAKVRPHDLTDMQQQVIDEVKKYADVYGNSLVIQHYPADTATVGTMKTFVSKLQNSGFMPDLVIIDYVGLIKPHRTYGAEHEETGAIVKAIMGFASEMDVSIWTAAQLNRSGMVMETPDESSMAGYVGQQYFADMVIWLAQTKEEREDECMRLVVSKNRNGLAGRTIPLSTNFNFMTFYREELQAEGIGSNGSGEPPKDPQ